MEIVKKKITSDRPKRDHRRSNLLKVAQICSKLLKVAQKSSCGSKVAQSCSKLLKVAKSCKKLLKRNIINQDMNQYLVTFLLQQLSISADGRHSQSGEGEKSRLRNSSSINWRDVAQISVQRCLKNLHRFLTIPTVNSAGPLTGMLMLEICANTC